MAEWQFGEWYRFRSLPSQQVIKRLPLKGTLVVEVLCEITAGPKSGQRLAYNGYINTADNAARTMRDLRAMGWKGVKWGDWSGLGAGREFESRVMADSRGDAVYPRMAFPRPVKTVDLKHEASAVDVDNLNAMFDLDVLEGVEVKQPVRASPAPTADATGAQGDSEDIPF